MSVYAARMKRNLRETIEQRDELLGRIRTVRENLDLMGSVDPPVADAVRTVLNYVETGETLKPNEVH